MFGYEFEIPRAAWPLLIGGGIALLVLRPLRSLAYLLLSGILVPITAGLLARLALMLWWFIKRIGTMHVDVVRHWVTPHRIMFPSLKARTPKGARTQPGKRAPGARSRAS